jgi:predicted dehydrogenase
MNAPECTLKMGMVGGGPGAFIGETHRRAARMDGGIELVAGVFSPSVEKNREMGRLQRLSADRVYRDHREMILREKLLPLGTRIDFVSIVTPNHLHLTMARDFLEAGFHLICDKPLALNLAEGRELQSLVKAAGKVFVLTHNYSGYPMVKLARDLVRQGEVGQVKKVVVEYQQGWLATEAAQSKQAEWRGDPRRNGLAGAMADIGTHAFHLTEYVTGIRVEEVCAELTAFGAGRVLEDDGSVFLRFAGGARGLLHASQVSLGQENRLSLEVYGERASLEWRQEDPNYLVMRQGNAPAQVWSRGGGYVARHSPAAARASRLPAGHVEGFTEAFANIYRNGSETIRAAISGQSPNELALDFPTVDDGVRGLAFLEAVVENARGLKKWTNIAQTD